MKQYSEEEISRSKYEALAWIVGNGEGFPRSWDEEAKKDIPNEIPAIIGYEVLEREGKVLRKGAVIKDSGQERIHFVLAAPPREFNPELISIASEALSQWDRSEEDADAFVCYLFNLILTEKDITNE